MSNRVQAAKSAITCCAGRRPGQVSAYERPAPATEPMEEQA